MNKKFECIYDEHVSCLSIIKCNNCGTVVFYRYDEDYEPCFKCPVCTDYKTRYTYWTQQEIKIDRDKQDVIKFYKKCNEISNEMDKRYLERGGLYDWQKSHKKTLFKFGKLMITGQLHGQYDEKWDTCIDLNIWWRTKDCLGHTLKKNIKIPLTLKKIF